MRAELGLEYGMESFLGGLRTGVLGDDAGGGGGGSGVAAGKSFKAVGLCPVVRTRDLERDICNDSSIEATIALLSFPSMSKYLSFRRNRFLVDPLNDDPPEPPGDNRFRLEVVVGAKLRRDPN